ncbi:unnamed protein product [Pleuronectes platessa]|uniref:Uncharacterized protein n=1 Tax=Pleuronectes platessa TaxID=8262 RepID=A0A9N7VJP0_PLEPL|nr:unnamed protein product [Pleuronectes platessa]
MSTIRPGKHEEQLREEITIIALQNTESEDWEDRSCEEALQEHLDIAPKANINLTAGTRRENLQQQKSAAKEKAVEAEQVNEVLQNKGLDLHTFLEKEKQLIDIKEVGVRAHTCEKTVNGLYL